MHLFSSYIYMPALFNNSIIVLNNVCDLQLTTVILSLSLSLSLSLALSLSM